MICAPPVVRRPDDHRVRLAVRGGTAHAKGRYALLLASSSSENRQVIHSGSWSSTILPSAVRGAGRSGCHRDVHLCFMTRLDYSLVNSLPNGHSLCERYWSESVSSRLRRTKMTRTRLRWEVLDRVSGRGYTMRLFAVLVERG
jgi:hypothetical protein